MQTFWQRYGNDVSGLSVEAAMAAASIDFEVAKRPLYDVVPGKGYERVGGAWATYRTDNGKRLGVVGDAYTPLPKLAQREDGTYYGAFAGLKQLVDAGLATMETAGSFRGGSDVFMQARLNLDSYPAIRDALGGAGVATLATITDNYTGRHAATLAELMIRIVCGNTFALARRATRKLFRDGGRGVLVRHSKDAVARMEEAAQKLWGESLRMFRDAALQASILRAAKLTEQEMGRLVVDLIAPMPEVDAHNADNRRTQASVELAEQRRRRLVTLWREGAGHSGDQSAWEALQAAVQSIDHDEHLWHTRGGPDGRALSLYRGTLAEKKTLVAESLIDHIIREQGDLVQRIVDRQTAAGSNLERVLMATA